MKPISVVCAVLLASGCFGRSASGASESPAPISGKQAFELVKGLAGEWRGTVHEQGKGPEVTVTYRVTSAGHAVLETLFPGTDHEMVTVYHLDKGNLVLTHYCAMGNQPHMALSKHSTATELIFDFAGGSNLNPKKDLHMHSARLHLDGPSTLSGEWSGYKEGKPAEVTRFFLSRTS